jgi:hypothetical protein
MTVPQKRKRQKYLKQQKLRRKRGLDEAFKRATRKLVIHWAQEELTNDAPEQASSTVEPNA